MPVYFSKEKALEDFQVASDLTDSELNRIRSPFVSRKRQSVKIGIIDDQPFEARQNLRSHGFDIEEIGDIKNVDEIADFQIVLCDLMGVGVFFDAGDQGASLIREIRRNFPDKIVAAYSGSSGTQGLVIKARDMADAFIKKDADIETWVDKLDQLIDVASDPRKVWSRVRQQLVAENLDTRQLVVLEDAFITSIRKQDKNFSLLRSVASADKVGGVASNIIQNMVAGGLLALLLGG